MLGRPPDTFHPALDATAIVLDPRTNAILAMSNWPRVNANDPAASVWHELRDRAQLRARVDVQGRRDRRRALRRPDLAGDVVHVPYAYHVADRMIHDSEVHPTESCTTAQILAQSSNVGAVKIGQTLAASRHQRFYDWMRPLRLRLADRHRPARARSRGSSRPPRSGRAPRSATCRSARASRSRRCRWRPPTRRSPTAACCARRTSSRASAACRRRLPPRTRILTPTGRRPSCARMLEGVLRPERHGVGDPHPGLRARRQDRHGQQGRQRHLLQQGLRRLVRRLRARRRTRRSRRRRRRPAAAPATSTAPRSPRRRGRRS